MRTELVPYIDKEIRIKGTFLDFGWNYYSNEPTILVRNIYLNDEFLTKHTWITVGDKLKDVELDKFDIIEFTTTVERYLKDSGDEDVAMEGIFDVEVLEKGRFKTELEGVFNFSFTLDENVCVKKSFGKPEVEVKQRFNFPKAYQGINPGEEVVMEIYAFRPNAIELKFKTESMQYFSKRMFFNPVKNGQCVKLNGKHKIYIPKDVYRRLKELFFKVYYTKTEYEIPMKFEPKVAYGRGEYLDIMSQASLISL